MISDFVKSQNISALYTKIQVRSSLVLHNMILLWLSQAGVAMRVRAAATSTGATGSLQGNVCDQKSGKIHF